MTSWGAYDNHARVGIDWTITPANPSYSDTSVTVKWYYYADSDGWTFSDNVTMHEGCSGWGGASPTFGFNTSGAAILVGTHSETYSISANSGSVTASDSLSGVYNGATPSHSVTVNLPNRPAAPVSVPSAGEGPAASNVTSSGATINWSAPTDNGGAAVDNYQLQVADNSGFTSPAIDVTGNVMSHVCTGLASNTKYYVRVRAHNSAGWGAWTSSTYCTFTTAAGGPGMPGPIQVTYKSKTDLDVSCAAAVSNGGTNLVYRFQCATDSAFSNLVYDSTTASTYYSFSNLTPGTLYYLRVRAETGQGISSYSNPATGETLPSGTYNDYGDLTHLVNNLAAAVGEKMMHLGQFYFGGYYGTFTVPVNTTTFISMGSTVNSDARPLAPTYSSLSNTSCVINYAGTYLIEFGLSFPAVSSGYYRIGININNENYISYYGGSSEGGANDFYVPPAGKAAVHQYSIVRHLDAGIPIGFYLNNYTPASIVLPSAPNSNLCAWARVTMIGF